MTSYRTLCDLWNRFFFEERPTESLALFRIVWMAMFFASFLTDIANVQDFYGPHALISLETTRGQFPLFHANLFHLFNPSYEFTYGLLAVFGIAIIFSMFGFLTRYSLIMVLLCVTSLHQRNVWILSSSETLVRIILIYLICSPCGHSLSIDSYLGRKHPAFRKSKNWPIWSLRLIQIQICVVYVWTVWHKLKGETWLDGTAVYYATRLENMGNFYVPYLLDSKLFIKLMTWGTLAVELAIGLLIWVKEFRWPVIIGGVLFHLGIEYVMCIPFFEINMMILLLNFVTPEEARAFADKLSKSFIQAIQDSTIAVNLKEKIVRTVKG